MDSVNEDQWTNNKKKSNAAATRVWAAASVIYLNKFIQSM